MVIPLWLPSKRKMYLSTTYNWILRSFSSLSFNDKTVENILKLYDSVNPLVMYYSIMKHFNNIFWYSKYSKLGKMFFFMGTSRDSVAGFPIFFYSTWVIYCMNRQKRFREILRFLWRYSQKRFSHRRLLRGHCTIHYTLLVYFEPKI